MNLNELLINHGRGRGKKSNKPKAINKLTPTIAAPPRKRSSTPSSDLNWGKSHISVPVTPSTARKSVSSSKVSTEEESKIIVALTEGRGEARCEVGIAVINVSRPLLILCQISDTQSYINTLTKINIFNPHEILIPATFVENFSGNRLTDIVKQQFPNIKYTPVARSVFNKVVGKEILSELCIPNLNSILLVLQHRYYALAAAAALITHVQDNLFIYYAVGSIKIDYQESEGYTIIDVSTADRMELVCSMKPAQSNKYSSLLGILNHCQTKIGTRTLRSTILQPPCDVKYIEERLNCVAELAKRPETLLSIQALLQKVPNVDMLLSIGTIIPDDPQRCSNRQLNYILLLNSLLDLITPLKDILAKLSQPFYKQLKSTLDCEEFEVIKKLVSDTIQDGAHPVKGQAGILQRCFAIKPGINGLLDLVRKTYSERIDDMREYVKKLAEKFNLALTLGNNTSKGHHIILTLNQQQKRYMKKTDLPEMFIHVSRLVGSFTMKTPELINLSTRVDDIMRDVLTISNVMVHSIIVEVKKYVGVFYKLCDEIAHLDVLQSLAEATVSNGYVRPNFGEFTEVTHGHHPLLDFLLSTRPIANHISCSNDFNVQIVTGPNGSGKSIFIRQVVLLQIMAQVGCYVPAQAAIFRPADRIFARIYLEDNMEYGASSFMLEMKEMKYITTTMTDNSLVIIDELCRSTSLEEGTALAIAILEKIAQSSAFIYITTHYTLLTKLYDMYLNVKVWQMETLPTGDDPRSFKLDFRHNLVQGTTSVKHYGVYIVRNIWSDSILKYIYELLDKITRKKENPKFRPIDEKIRLKYSVEAEFRKIKSQKKLTIAEINKILNQYQNDLQKLGHFVDPINVAPAMNLETFQESLPEIRHSVFDASQNFDSAVLYQNQIQEDLQSVDDRMRQMFTPQPALTSQKNDSFCNFQTPSFPLSPNFSENSSCRDLTKFIDANSENLRQLEPEIGLSWENTPNASQSSSDIIQNRYGLFGTDFVEPSIVNKVPTFQPPGGENTTYKSASTVDLSENMDQFRFSEPLRADFSKTSTPMVHPTPYSKNPSPLVKIYNHGGNFSTSSSASYKKNNENDDESKKISEIDTISIQEELEICSKVFGSEDDFEETVFSLINESSKNQEDSRDEKVEPILERPRHQDLMPKVTIIEGANNTTLSFGENDITTEQPKDGNKINVTSNVLIQKEDRPPSYPNPIETQTKEPFRSYETTDSAENEDVPFETWSKMYDEGFAKHQPRQKAEELLENPAKALEMMKDAENIENGESHPDTSQVKVDASKEDNVDESDTSSVSSEQSEGKHGTGDISVEDKTKNEVEASRADIVEEAEKSSRSKESEEENETANSFVEEGSKQCKILDSSNVDKTVVTSISNASKLRNLEQATSDSSPQEENSTEKKTTTSMTSVSRKRNLDEATATSSGELKKSTSKSETSSSIKESDDVEQKTLPKIHSSQAEEDPKIKKVKRRAPYRRKFVPPRKLSAKEIRQEFQEQDRKMLEGSSNSSNYSKYLEQLINRPTVKQIQNTTHVAYIKRTEDGFQVIPAQPPAKKRKKSPIKKQFSNENFNMSIFSDKNAQPFEMFLNSNEKDYNAFTFNSFNFKKGNQEAEKGDKFQFEPTIENVGEYTNKSVTMHFVRNKSDSSLFERNGEKELKTLVRRSSEMIKTREVFTQQGIPTMTPDGFYKKNKDDINRIMDKYLCGTTVQEPRADNHRNVGMTSIFEKDLYVDDLDL